MITISQNKRLTAIMLIIVILLAIPLIAMQFTSQVQWSLFDFAVAAVLLLGAGLLCEFVLRKIKSVRQRVILVAVVLSVLILVWMELAVGIFGTPLAGS